MRNSQLSRYNTWSYTHCGHFDNLVTNMSGQWSTIDENTAKLIHATLAWREFQFQNAFKLNFAYLPVEMAMGETGVYSGVLLTASSLDYLSVYLKFSNVFRRLLFVWFDFFCFSIFYSIFSHKILVRRANMCVCMPSQGTMVSSSAHLQPFLSFGGGESLSLTLGW